eukprot:COSAG02_NODE_430_length_22462_cov_52.755042_17_plen_35_part_00
MPACMRGRRAPVARARGARATALRNDMLNKVLPI